MAEQKEDSGKSNVPFVHFKKINIFGLKNVGKSNLINYLDTLEKFEIDSHSIGENEENLDKKDMENLNKKDEENSD